MKTAIRFFAAALCFVSAGFAAHAVHAADEFGARFSNKGPAALSDPAAPDGSAVQNIEPAAGAEEDPTAAPDENAAAVIPPRQDPAATTAETDSTGAGAIKPLDAQ